MGCENNRKVLIAVTGVSPAEFALLVIVAQRIIANRMPQSWYDLEPGMNDLLARNDVPLTVDWFHQLKERKAMEVVDFRKWAASARKKLKGAFALPELAGLLLPSMRGGIGNLYPAEKIEVLSR